MIADDDDDDDGSGGDNYERDNHTKYVCLKWTDPGGYFGGTEQLTTPFPAPDHLAANWHMRLWMYLLATEAGFIISSRWRKKNLSSMPYATTKGHICHSCACRFSLDVQVSLEKIHRVGQRVTLSKLAGVNPSLAQKHRVRDPLST